MGERVEVVARPNSSGIPVSSRLFVAIAIAVLTMIPRVASALPSLECQHAQGAHGKYIAGWNEVVVTLRNTDMPAWSGEVLVDAGSGPGLVERSLVRVPVTLGAGEGATRLHLPFYVLPGSVPSVRLRTSADGIVASRVLEAVSPQDTAGTIVEVHLPAFGEKLRELYTGTAAPARGESPDPLADGPFAPEKATSPLVPGGTPVTPGASMTHPTADVVSAEFARETSDPILPEFAAGWGGAMLVVTSSDIIARLPPRSFDALEQWVLSGGVLAISVVREEDLRSAALVSLLGTQARIVGNSGADERSFAGEGLTRGDVSKAGSDGEFAKHGRGETWLLRNDPWKRSSESDSRKSIYALWYHAVAPRPVLLSAPAGLPPRWVDDPPVRVFLDPNHAIRPALGLAATLVGLYALLVGPLAFARARRLGKPLSVLQLTPILALVLFAALVTIGKIGKGVRGRVRKLSIVDAAAGQKRATSTTFHGFYVSDPASLELPVSKPSDTIRVVEPYSDDAAIDLDRTGMVVRSVRAHPWEAVVLAEDSTRDLGGGVALQGVGGLLTLTNNTPWPLLHVMLHPATTATSPARSRYFARVEPGESVMAHDGVPVDRAVMPTALKLLPNAKNEDPKLRADRESAEALDAVASIVAAWSTFMAPRGLPLPYQEPVATALISMPTGKESGYSVERDVMYLRVIGTGGINPKGELPPEKPKGKEDSL